MERTYGLLLRVYTPKLGEVTERVERALKHIRQTLAVSEGFPALKHVVLVVPSDYDCGYTYRALLECLGAEGLLESVVLCNPSGHHSCDALNHGLDFARLDNTSHALIVSGKAMSYLTVPAMRAIDKAFEKGAKVSGLAVDELRSTVLGGCVQNTFAAWNVKALLQSSQGFDSKEGVEEIAPLVRLTQMFGKCIAPIDVGTGTLDVHTSESAKARHEFVMTTKLERQTEELRRVHSDFAAIKFGVMPNYPRSI